MEEQNHQDMEHTKLQTARASDELPSQVPLFRQAVAEEKKGTETHSPRYGA